ncbi:hypothetical protein F5H01DRAFT_182498 [Linnemannia elongata]|nr:hypothetical protein F5H01DRAFT_182498 [Linnemannia elongata]
MVFVNGQKFACATCIKGHRSTTCNHGERPLHEIKKKGRPSTQCPHCKELRKAKQVNVRCICGREEGAAAVANGLKRAKSLSHDGRLTIPAIGGEELLRSVSTQGQSPQDSSSDAQSSTGGLSHCGCLDGRVCTCCRDRTGHVVVKPSKGSAHANSATFKNYPTNRQRSAASLDLGKSGMLLFPRDTSSPLPFVPHGQNNQVVQSPDSFGSQGKANAGIYASGASPLFAQTLSPSSSSGCDHSPSTSSLGSHQSGQMQSHLCFDYASSSDYDSDHYPTTSYSYFPETMASYPVSNASDDLEDMDMLANADPKTIMDARSHRRSLLPRPWLPNLAVAAQEIGLRLLPPPWHRLHPIRLLLAEATLVTRKWPPRWMVAVAPSPQTCAAVVSAALAPVVSPIPTTRTFWTPASTLTSDRPPPVLPRLLAAAALIRPALL